MVKEKCSKLNEFLTNLLVQTCFIMEKSQKKMKSYFGLLLNLKQGINDETLKKRGFPSKINWEAGQK